MKHAQRTFRTLLFVAVIAAAWIASGPQLAFAIAFTVVAYLFVLAMQVAREEIRRIQKEERPDLYEVGHRSGRESSAF